MSPDPSLQQRLEQARDEALRQAADLAAQVEQVVAASEASNADDEHDPEGHTIAYERQQLAALRAQAEQRAAELDRALTQLAAGEYGRCERCGEPIDPERLAARPQARTCISCARAT